jgi:hypothetical protein
MLTGKQAHTPAWLWLDWRLLVLLTTLALGLIGLTLVFAPQPPPPITSSLDQVDPAQVAALQLAWGIRFTNVVLTGDDGIVDVRFQVIDPDKAIGLLDEENFPVLIDEASGQTLSKTAGHGGHTKGFKAGRTTYLLYENTGRLLRPGSRVTIRIGDVALENVLVR